MADKAIFKRSAFDKSTHSFRRVSFGQERTKTCPYLCFVVHNLRVLSLFSCANTMKNLTNEVK